MKPERMSTPAETKNPAPGTAGGAGDPNERSVPRDMDGEPLPPPHLYAAGYALIFLGTVGLGLLLVLLTHLLR